MLPCCPLIHRKRHRWLRVVSICCLTLLLGMQLLNEQLFWASTPSWRQHNIHRGGMNATEHQQANGQIFQPRDDNNNNNEIKAASPVSIIADTTEPANTPTAFPADSATSFFEAYFPNGSFGYVADPFSLKFGISSVEQSLRANTTNDDSTTLFWYLLANYEQSTLDHSISSTEVCSFGPGQGLEEEGGWKLLTEKIRLYNDQTKGQRRSSSSSSNNKSIRLLCTIYTHAPMRHQARAAALTWGKQCDGFLAFSTETVQSLGILHLQHNGPESYFNMWQKVRSIWAYIATHYLNDFDFVHLCGDDTYILVDNLRDFLQQHVQDSNSSKPMHWGQWIRQKYAPYTGGGPGYTINRAALKLFLDQALDSCNTDTQASFEDRLFSNCMQSLGVMPGDTRDKKTGEQRYHDASPQHLYTSRVIPDQKRPSFHARGMAYWETLLFPEQYPAGVWRPFINNMTNAPSVGRKHHLESAATHSVAFHNIFNSLYMTRVHVILNPSLCPLDSPLQRGLNYYAVA